MGYSPVGADCSVWVTRTDAAAGPPADWGPHASVSCQAKRGFSGTWREGPGGVFLGRGRGAHGPTGAGRDWAGPGTAAKADHSVLQAESEQIAIPRVGQASCRESPPTLQMHACTPAVLYTCRCNPVVTFLFNTWFTLLVERTLENFQRF